MIDKCQIHKVFREEINKMINNKNKTRNKIKIKIIIK
jgi:hypothetical protein